MGYSDREIEARFAWCDPAFLPEEEPEEENDDQIIMGELFAELEKLFATYGKYEKGILANHDDEIIDKVYELMEV